MRPPRDAVVPRRAEGAILAALVVALSVVPAAFASLSVGSPTAQATTAEHKTCLDGGTAGAVVPMNTTVAAVVPVFTATPYSQYPYGSFYAFYKAYSKATNNITSNLDWLSTSIKSGLAFGDGWGHSAPLRSFLESPAAASCGLVMGKNLRVISDMNVSAGDLFNPDGGRRFDAVILGHEEYVTRTEYDQLRLFVASGGKVVAMDSNDFYAEVRYNPSTQMETFVLGHGGYAFNGRTAWHSASNPIPWNTSGWFGSTYCCFHRFRFFGGAVNVSNNVGRALNESFGQNIAAAYASHEENRVSNLSGTSIVATFVHVPGYTVASYEHRYGRGSVWCFCVFGDDLIGTDRSTQYFLIASVVGDRAPAVVTTVPAQGNGAATFRSILGVLLVLAIAVPLAVLAWRHWPRPDPRPRGAGLPG